MAGAACLSARAAYRMGAGLVKIFTPEENRIIVQENSRRRSFPVTMREKPEKIRRALRERSQGETEWADVIVLGPGIGMEDHARLMVENVLKDAYVPIILDADAESRRGVPGTHRLFYRKYHRDAAYEGNVAAHRNSDRGEIKGKSDPCSESLQISTGGLRLKGRGDRDRGKRRERPLSMEVGRPLWQREVPGMF